MLLLEIPGRIFDHHVTVSHHTTFSIAVIIVSINDIILITLAINITITPPR